MNKFTTSTPHKRQPQTKGTECLHEGNSTKLYRDNRHIVKLANIIFVVDKTAPNCISLIYDLWIFPAVFASLWFSIKGLISG